MLNQTALIIGGTASFNKKYVEVIHQINLT